MFFKFYVLSDYVLLILFNFTSINVDRWWAQFGDDAPELQAFAIKVLSLTCSASGCERNWSIFNQIHTKKRNRLSTTRMNKLAFIMFNKKLKDRHLKLTSRQSSNGEEFDPLVVDALDSDDEWLMGEAENEERAERESGEATTSGSKRKRPSENEGQRKKRGNYDHVANEHY